MLDPEFKAKWVAALESGEYHQGRQVLYSSGSDSYCCLGVACKVADAKFKTIKENVFSELRAYRNGVIISDENISLTRDFMKEIGLTDEEQMKLYHMNDGHLPEEDPQHVRRHTFQEIAAYIREKL